MKTQTRPLHDRLEARVDVLNRIQQPQNYQSLLAAFYGFYAPVETRLAKCEELSVADVDFELRRKLPLLVTDLEQSDVEVQHLPQCTRLPQIETAAEGFGCLYVLEGATLGGQMISRLLAQHLQMTADNGGAFFNAYGDQVRTMWQEFRQRLSQFASTHPDERDTILATAKETFSTLDDWFATRLG